jgi:hypothetical protein
VNVVINDKKIRRTHFERAVAIAGRFEMKKTKEEEEEREEEWDSSNQNSFYEDLDPGKNFVLDDLISTWQNLIPFLVLLKYVSLAKSYSWSLEKDSSTVLFLRYIL